MKIISSFYTQNIFQTKNNRAQSVNNYQTPVIKSLACDMVSFGRTAGNAESLRALMSYKIPDMYSGKIVIDPAVVKQLFERDVFSSSIKNIVKVLQPLESSLHNVEKEVFSLIKLRAKQNPDKKLHEVMKELAVSYEVKLLKKQQPIFDRLNVLSKGLPPEQKEQFDKLMEIANKKITKKRINLPFSAKEFRYKLGRISDEISAKENKEEFDAIKRIIRLAQQIPENTKVDISNDLITSKAKKNKKVKSLKAISRRRSETLNKIESVQMSSPLKNNEELKNLMAQTRSKIFNIPVVSNFNRKTFIYELQKITSKLENKTLANEMIRVATELPKSRQDVSAFIVKAANTSSEKIGYDLIVGSVGCIEHLIPFAKKGKDSLENYAITTAYFNSERGSRSMIQQLALHPETYKNCQKQVDRLINLYNNGVFEKVGLTKWYIINLAKRMYRLSPPDNKLLIDLSRLKD